MIFLFGDMTTCYIPCLKNAMIYCLCSHSMSLGEHSKVVVYWAVAVLHVTLHWMTARVRRRVIEPQKGKIRSYALLDKVVLCVCKSLDWMDSYSNLLAGKIVFIYVLHFCGYLFAWNLTLKEAYYARILVPINNLYPVWPTIEVVVNLRHEKWTKYILL